MTSKVQKTTKLTGGLMAAVLAGVLTMTLNTGAATAATQEASTDAATGTQSADIEECAAPQGAAAMASVSDTPEMIQLESEAATAAAAQVVTLADQAGIAPYTSPDFVARDGFKAYAIDFAGVKATSVSFPIEGGAYVQPSNVTYILDEAGQLAQYSESTVVERADGVLDVNTYRDGALIQSAEVDPGADLSALSAGASAAAAVDPVTCLMAVLGVSSIVAGTILILCGGSCSVPVTPPTATICAACIGGIAIVGGASITAVMGCMSGG